MSRLAVFMPDPALITSIMTLGSRPDLTPITTASEVATTAVADSRLFASFMVCAEPGFSPMKNTLPITSSAGLHRLEIRFGTRHHDRERALLGAADAAAHGTVELHDVAFRQQVVNAHRHVRPDGGEIDEALDALAFDHAARAGRDLERSLQRRQARQHGLGAVGDVLWRGCGLRAERDQFVDRLLALVEHDELMLRLDQAAGHGKAHLPRGR